MFGYTVSMTANEKTFQKICDIIENELSPITKGNYLVDVDGSLIQNYRVGCNKIIIHNDYDIDAVYVDSDIDLSKLLVDYIVVTYNPENV